MHNHLTWPPLRTDAIGVVCVVFAFGCLIAGRWPALAGLALVGAIFCAVSPRMRGPFGFQGGGTSIGGTFDEDTGAAVVRGRLSPPAEESPPPTRAPRPPSSSRGPGGG